MHSIDLSSLVWSSVLIAGLSLVKIVLSEAVLGKIVLIILRHLAVKTTNSIDDEIVAAVEAALAAKSSQ